MYYVDLFHQCGFTQSLVCLIIIHPLVCSCIVFLFLGEKESGKEETQDIEKETVDGEKGKDLSFENQVENGGKTQAADQTANMDA